MKIFEIIFEINIFLYIKLKKFYFNLEIKNKMGNSAAKKNQQNQEQCCQPLPPQIYHPQPQIFIVPQPQLQPNYLPLPQHHLPQHYLPKPQLHLPNLFYLTIEPQHQNYTPGFHVY
jgi:hypothetical protein